MTHADVVVNEQGRVTIPAPLRQQLGLVPGSRAVAYVDDGRLVIEDRRHLLARLQDEVALRAGSAGPEGGVVDELIAERRAEASAENEAWPPFSTPPRCWRCCSARRGRPIVLGLRVEPFTLADARTSARLWVQGRALGLSLAARACLALADRLQAEAWTADRVWATGDLGVRVRLIR